jgi:hypothetical protein
MLHRSVTELTARNLRQPYVATGHTTWCCKQVGPHSQLQTGYKQSKKRGRLMFKILVLICSTTLSHADCQAKTAVDVVQGPTVDNEIMCGLNAQTMIARTDLVQNDGSEYMKIVCTRSKNAEQWVAEIEARKAAIQ